MAIYNMCARFQNKPLFQATKQLNGGGENVGYLSAAGCGVLVFSVWKNSLCMLYIYIVILDMRSF